MDYNKAIESVCFKFGHAVTEYDVFRWLRNFDESEWTMALNVLDKVVYYSSDMIDENLEYQIKKILEENPGQHIYILPSGNVDRAMLPRISLIRKIVKEEGFALNEKKTELLHQGNKQMVTGLLVDGRVRVPGTYKRDILRHIHFCQKYGGRGHFNRVMPGKAYGREWLEGRIRYVYSVEPEAAKKMWMEFEKIDWGY